ncbi:MAG: VTT domain-containing protein [Deltaproteobacteria bacterium]|nr:VTT domain-containing protein [Deltaproteobacteria bacterium]
MPAPSLLAPGRNCWRIARAERAAVLVDGDAYFSAFREAASRAERSIFILGWDVHSRAELLPCGPADELPVELGRFLDALATRRRDLHIYVLSWDFAVIYAFEREPAPVFNLGWRTHDRLHFRLDDDHPVGASHHQKVVVIDDRVAFSGGFDLTQRRWDTPLHRGAEPCRTDPGGRPYGPFHDIQMLVDGSAAAALGELARERWRRATGQRTRPVRVTGADPWPASVEPELTGVDVAISRTEPLFRGRAEVREVEALYLDSIRAAERFLYIENQYFTSALVCDALAARLREEAGPELVLVFPRRCSGWLEESTMGVLRERKLRRLREADRFGRLRIYVPRSGRAEVNLHSKLFIADDKFLRVGSANLSNRSLGMDTECDLAVEAASPRHREAIEAIRCRLLGEHLGVPAESVRAAGRDLGSLAAAVESLRTEGTGLVPLEEDPTWLDFVIPEGAVIDPERPAPAAQLFDEFVPYETREPSGRPVLRGAVALIGLGLLTAAWHWTALGEYLHPAVLARAFFPEAGPAYTLLVVVLGYAAAGAVSFPVTVLIAATALAYPPISAFLYSLAGSLASASLTYWLGRVLGRSLLDRLGGRRLRRVRRFLARRGILTMATLRLVPIAPFSLVNAAAGASRVRFRDFFVGTVLGMAPGIFVITVLENRIGKLIEDPKLGNFAVVALAVAVAVVAGTWVTRRLRAR